METKKFLTGGRLLVGCFVLLTALVGCNNEPSDSESEPSLFTIAKPEAVSLKEKFGIEAEGVDSVNDTFTAVHYYLASKPAITVNSNNIPKMGVISLGDWIDLEGGLQVAEYVRSGETAADGGAVNNGFVSAENDHITYNDKDCGTLLRLIVVGINSFSETKVSDTDETLINPDAPPHLVFQFQNIPARHRMNPTETNVGGYKASEMREYLVHVTGKTGSGAFLAGLKEAGIPENFLWAPTRIIAYGYGAVEPNRISDLLWLPTRGEMELEISVTRYGETAANRGYLQYYTDFTNKAKRKLSGDSSGYFVSTPISNDEGRFCTISISGLNLYYIADRVYGAVPAFCVK